jgi:hypothetical protein
LVSRREDENLRYVGSKLKRHWQRQHLYFFTP